MHPYASKKLDYWKTHFLSPVQKKIFPYIERPQMTPGLFNNRIRSWLAALSRIYPYSLCGFKVVWGIKSSSSLNPTALAYSSIVDSFGDIFECTFSRREILLFCVCSLLASSSWVKPAFLRRPINVFLR